VSEIVKIGSPQSHGLHLSLENPAIFCIALVVSLCFYYFGHSLLYASRRGRVPCQAELVDLPEQKDTLPSMKKKCSHPHVWYTDRKDKPQCHDCGAYVKSFGVLTSPASYAGRKLSELGASKGGKARANALSPARRSEIARLAVKTRWSRSQRLAFLLRDMLTRMEHEFDPFTGNHRFTMKEPLVITDELKGFIDSFLPEKL